MKAYWGFEGEVAVGAPHEALADDAVQAHLGFKGEVAEDAPREVPVDGAVVWTLTPLKGA